MLVMPILKISLFGVLRVFSPSGDEIILGAKHQALLVLLATENGGGRTRFMLESMLWSRSQPEQARASLRTALSTLRQILGPASAGLLSANRERVLLDLDGVDFVSSPSQGTLMEGFHLVNEPKFNDWLKAIRDTYFPTNLFSKVDRGSVLETLRQPIDDLVPKISVLPLVSKVADKQAITVGTLLTEELVRHLSRTQVFAEISCLAPKSVEPFVESAVEIGREANALYHLSGVLHSQEPRNSLKLTLLDVASGKVLWGGYSEGSAEEFIAIDTILLSSLTQQASQAIVCNEYNLRPSLRSVGDHECQKLVIASISLSLDVIELPIPDSKIKVTQLRN